LILCPLRPLEILCFWASLSGLLSEGEENGRVTRLGVLFILPLPCFFLRKSLPWGFSSLATFPHWCCSFASASQPPCSGQTLYIDHSQLLVEAPPPPPKNLQCPVSEFVRSPPLCPPRPPSPPLLSSGFSFLAPFFLTVESFFGEFFLLVGSLPIQVGRAVFLCLLFI